jgi:SAM-dependent methyltransferase
MIDAVESKLQEQERVRNIIPVCADLKGPDDERIVKGENGGRFDLVISHLVLHHIPSLEDTFKTMHGCLKSGGSVALTDFEDFGPEARRQVLDLFFSLLCFVSL